MKKEFVKTENDVRFRAALVQKAKETRAASESGGLVVFGRAGDGKTRTLHNWGASVNAAVLTAYPGWTPRRMLMELAAVLAIPVAGAWEQAVASQVAAEEIPIVVDEAGFALANNAACLERLRSITDKSGTLLVMVVMQSDMANLKRYDQITSRSTMCQFHPSTVADVAAACAQLSAVTIEPDLVQRIYKDSGARMRLVIEGISVAERVGLQTGKSSVKAADLKSFMLCEDFNTTAFTARAGRK